MLEMNLCANVPSDGGSGEEFELSSSKFITYAEITNLVGITQGSPATEDKGWLRFLLDGKELIVSKVNVRRSINWNALNSAGVVLGNRIITILDKQYKLRLLKGADTDPAVIASPGYGNYLGGTHNSEWSRLFYPLVKDDSSLPPEATNPNAPYTRSDIDIGHASWCQERIASGIFAGWYISRGGSNSVTSITPSQANVTNTAIGWRPCLELIP